MKNHSSKSTLFLIELVIAILFFSITSAVCVQIFVKAHIFSRETKQLNYALNKISTVNAYVRAYDGDIDKIADSMQGENTNDILTCYYDDSWNSCDKQNAKFLLTAIWKGSEKVVVYIDDILQQREILLQTLAYHAPLRAGGIADD